MGDRRGARRRSLAADHARRVFARAAGQNRHLAARAVEMRLNDLQDETRGDGGIEGVAAAFEHAHAGGGLMPPCRKGGEDCA
jgi:hypothetical protein